MVRCRECGAPNPARLTACYNCQTELTAPSVPDSTPDPPPELTPDISSQPESRKAVVPSEIIIPLPVSVALESVARMLDRVGQVTEVDSENQIVDGGVAYGICAVAIRLCLAEYSAESTLVSIQAFGGDIWGTAARGATRRILAALANFNMPIRETESPPTVSWVAIVGLVLVCFSIAMLSLIRADNSGDSPDEYRSNSTDNNRAMSTPPSAPNIPSEEIAAVHIYAAENANMAALLAGNAVTQSKFTLVLDATTRYGEHFGKLIARHIDRHETHTCSFPHSRDTYGYDDR